MALTDAGIEALKPRDGRCTSPQVSYAVAIQSTTCWRRLKVFIKHALVIKPHEKVINYGQARTRTSTLQPTGRSALHSCNYQIMRSRC